jgi:uncharacterized protein Usg
MGYQDFYCQLEGCSLTTAHILYRMPDHPKFLQSYIWQDYDRAPDFPLLNDFLKFWQRELDGPLHSVCVASRRLIGPSNLVAVNGLWTLN